MKKLLIITSICLCRIVYPQVNEDWVARFSGTLTGGYDVAYNIAVDESGNIYVTG